MDSRDLSIALLTLQEVRDALVVKLREARIENDRAKNVYASPYSSHDAMVAYHRAFGEYTGLARSIEVIDALIEGSPDLPDCPECKGKGYVPYPVTHPTNPNLDTWQTAPCGTCATRRARS